MSVPSGSAGEIKVFAVKTIFDTVDFQQSVGEKPLTRHFWKLSKKVLSRSCCEVASVF